VNFVHSSRKRAAVAREMHLGGAKGSKGVRLLNADTAGGLAKAVEKLSPTRIGIQIEVPELHRGARLVVYGSVARGCWEACGCG